MQRERYDLRSVVRAQLVYEMADMHFDCALAHLEFLGDGPVRLALPKALQHLHLTRREIRLNAHRAR